MTENEEYERYLREEWRRFFADPSRAEAARAAVASISLRRILDVGCGAGQELFPFVADPAVLGVGIDLAASAGAVGHDLYARRAPSARIAFVHAAAEALPFPDDAFDLIVFRLALPYTHNRQALGEIARVLRPGGILLLKAHHLRYYLRRLAEGLGSGRGREAVHAIRVLLAGAIYHISSWQPRTRRGHAETFQTGRRLRRELSRLELRIVGELPDSNPATPSYVVRRRTPGAAAEGVSR